MPPVAVCARLQDNVCAEWIQLATPQIDTSLWVQSASWGAGVCALVFIIGFGTGTVISMLQSVNE